MWLVPDDLGKPSREGRVLQAISALDGTSKRPPSAGGLPKDVLLSFKKRVCVLLEFFDDLRRTILFLMPQSLECVHAHKALSERCEPTPLDGMSTSVTTLGVRAETIGANQGL